jgi:sugar phosphate isomerase/epimerase
MSIEFGLLTVSYSGLWHDGPALSIPEQIEKADALGYDAVSIETKRPTASPIDLDEGDRQAILEASEEHGIDICAVESMSDFSSRFMEERENNLAMMRMVLDLADDLGVDLVKVFPAWPGVDDSGVTATYGDMPLASHWEQQYPGTERFAKWDRVVEGVREVADWAADRGIDLALQNHNHPPVLAPGYEDAKEMLEEIDRDNVGLCLDPVPFYERQSDEYVREAVQACADDILLSHYGAWDFERRDGEVVQIPSPLSGVRINDETFLEELERIGYDGYFVSEYCLPALENHGVVGGEAIDEANRPSLEHVRGPVSETGSEQVTADDD